MNFTPKGTATRQRIIEGAASHLRSEDPVGVTLDDIRARTSTSKSQLFHYFPGGKEELFLAIARYEADRVIEDQQPHLDSLDSWESWSNWRDALIARYRAQGAQCPMATLMSQVGNVPGAADVASALLIRWQAKVERGIRRMQGQGDVRASLDPTRMSAAFIAGIQGGVTVLRSTGDVSHLEAVLDVLLEHLRTVELPDNALVSPRK
jgi:AcrR family transcriptional regulator